MSCVKKNPDRQEALKPPDFLGPFFFLFNLENLEKTTVWKDIYVVFSFPN